MNRQVHAAGAGGPLRAVLAAAGQGVSTLEDLAGVTGLSRDVVDAAVEHLVRARRLEAVDLSAACPASGCGTCPLRPGGRASCATGSFGWRGSRVVAYTVPRAPAPAPQDDGTGDLSEV